MYEHGKLNTKTKMVYEIQLERTLKCSTLFQSCPTGYSKHNLWLLSLPEQVIMAPGADVWGERMLYN